MKKRVAAAVLWFNAGWFVGSALAFVAGLSPALGPIVATAAAAIIAVDPRRLIWTAPTAPAMIPTAPKFQVQNPV